MADSEFKHIAVTAAEEDDFVIRAGVVDRTDDALPAEPDAALEPQTEPASSPESVSEPELTPEPQPEPARKAAQTSPARKPSAKKDDGYRETTLEDLESTKMPLAQKVVIAAAIVCIIGAVIYYLAFLR